MKNKTQSVLAAEAECLYLQPRLHSLKGRLALVNKKINRKWTVAFRAGSLSYMAKLVKAAEEAAELAALAALRVDEWTYTLGKAKAEAEKALDACEKALDACEAM